jgi:hypothetical protein
MALAFSLITFLACASAARAQMVTGKAMDNFAGAFGLTGGGAVVQETDFSIAGKTSANVLWPGESARITFHIKVPGGYAGPIKFDLMQYGTRAIPGDMWKPHVFKIADISSISVDANLPDKGDFITIAPAIPQTFGGYAIMTEIPGKCRFFGAALCRAMAAAPGRV